MTRWLALLCLLPALAACKLPTRGERELLSAVKGAKTRTELESRLGDAPRYHDFAEVLIRNKGVLGREVYTTAHGSLAVNYLDNVSMQEAPTQVLDFGSYPFKVPGGTKYLHTPAPDNPVAKLEIYHDGYLDEIDPQRRELYLRTRFARNRGQLERALGPGRKTIAQDLTLFSIPITYNLTQVYQVDDLYVQVAYTLDRSQVRMKETAPKSSQSSTLSADGIDALLFGSSSFDLSKAKLKTRPSDLFFFKAILTQREYEARKSFLGGP